MTWRDVLALAFLPAAILAGSALGELLAAIT